MTGEIKVIIRGDSSQYENELRLVDNKVEDTEAKIDAAQRKYQLTVTGILIGLRAITDTAALVSAVSGETVDVAAFAMMSMAISQVMQVKAQAVIYMATPGLQPLGMAMLAMIPMLTGLIMFIKGQQAKAQQAFLNAQRAAADLMIDQVNY